jgi:EmrB/QacA subfamily drug resistance transporter
VTLAQKRLTLAAAIVGSIVAFVDGTVVNVALPHIRDDLGGGLSGQQWLTDAYLLTLGSLLLVGGSIGDLFGRRRAFAAGLVGFGAASILCAIAPTIGTLIAFRALQGVAGALLVPNTLGLIVARFEQTERGGAIGAWTAWSGIAIVIGPLLGGLLLQAGSWRWIFAINVIPIALALWLTSRLDATHDAPAGGQIDHIGAVLATLGLGGPVYALIEGPSRGWGDPVILVSLIGGLALLAAFVVYEADASHPMLSLELFRQRNFTVGNAATLAVYGGLGSAPFFLVLFLQQVAGYSPIAAGAALLPVTIIMFALSARWGALADRIGPRVFMGAGPLIGGAGIVWLGHMGASPDYWTDLFPAVIVFGLGLSLTVAPLTATVLGGVAEEHAGVASAVNNATARIGSLLAVAAVGAVVAAQFSSSLKADLQGVPLPRGYLSQASNQALVADAPATLGSARPRAQAALDDAAVDAFGLGMTLTGLLIALGGVLSALGIENPKRSVPCADCPGGAAVGASEDLGRVALPRYQPAGAAR